MDKCAALKSWHAYCYHASYVHGKLKDPENDQEKWLIDYSAPSRFKIRATDWSSHPVFTLVSDGSKMATYGEKGPCAQIKDAPSSFSGLGNGAFPNLTEISPLPLFFGGRQGFDRLVDTMSEPVIFDTKYAPESDGQQLKWVKFHGTGDYGEIEAAIDVNSGLVHNLMWDNVPMIVRMAPMLRQIIPIMRSSAGNLPAGKERTQMEKSVEDMEAALKDPAAYTQGEGYPANMMSFMPLRDSIFSTKLPRGVTLMETPPSTIVPPNPPVPIGTPMPDFEVTTLDGVTVKLSSLRGHPVFIDFWATWCLPCIGSLPHTQDIYRQAKSQGLQVLVISDEEKSVVSQFIQENHYTFPTYLDAGGKTSQSLKVDSIPRMFIIDADGNLAACLVGAGEEAAIKEALAKVGIRVD